MAMKKFLNVFVFGLWGAGRKAAVNPVPRVV